MPPAPRVSVLIPCYNLGEYLPEAIASVRRQTFSAFEIIVVDDGSTEASVRDAIAAAAGSDLREVRSENRGLSAARNLGIAHARGEYISCLDADDLFEPEWLSDAVACLDRNPDAAFVSHWLQAFGEEEWPWEPGRADLGALLDQNVFNGAALFRRDIVERVGGFDETMRDGCEDWEFWIRVLTAGYRGRILPAALYRYRRRADSMSRAMVQDDRWFELFGQLIEKHPDAYADHLIDLLLRREAAIARMCRGIEGVREELSTILEPAVRDRGAELDSAQTRLADRLAREELAAKLQAAEHETEQTAARLEQTTDALQQTAATLEQTVATLEQTTATLEETVAVLADARVSENQLRGQLAAQTHAAAEAARRADELKQSWSWRVTAPLRRVYEWLGLAGAAKR